MERTNNPHCLLGYQGGHMIYIRKEDLAVSIEHIREFINNSTSQTRATHEVLANESAIFIQGKSLRKDVLLKDFSLHTNYYSRRLLVGYLSKNTSLVSSALI